MADYSFVTRWTVNAPLESVWDAIYHSEKWPAWWKGVERVEQVGPARRFTWKGRLPYQLTFDMTVTRVEPMRLIESTAEGELSGTGRWTFEAAGGVTRVRYDWNVRTAKPWMNLLAPIARPLFRWNHDVIMRWGLKGLQRMVK